MKVFTGTELQVVRALKKRGFAAILFAKTIKHAVSTRRRHLIDVPITITWNTPEFARVVRKLGFRVTKTGKAKPAFRGTRPSGKGLVNSRNNMRKFYCVEARNPETNKVKVYNFRVQE